MKNRLPLIAWAALPLTLGLAFAAQPQRVQPVQPGQTQQGQNLNQPGMPQNQPGRAQPGQNGQRPAAPQNSGTNYADVFLQKLAAQLGISVDRLRAAAIAAGSATIDQGVKAGDFPADRAAEMKGRLNENPFAFGGHGPGRPGGPGHEHGGPGGMDRGPRGGGAHDHGQPKDRKGPQGTIQNSTSTF